MQCTHTHEWRSHTRAPRNGRAASKRDRRRCCRNRAVCVINAFTRTRSIRYLALAQTHSPHNDCASCSQSRSLLLHRRHLFIELTHIFHFGFSVLFQTSFRCTHTTNHTGSHRIALNKVGITPTTQHTHTDELKLQAKRCVSATTDDQSA